MILRNMGGGVIYMAAGEEYIAAAVFMAPGRKGEN